MALRGVWFWKDVLPLLKRLAKETGTPLNRLVNLAVLEFLRGPNASVERLRLEAHKLELFREEADIRKTWCTIARSGAYLEQYAVRVLMPQEYRELMKVQAREDGFYNVRDVRRGRVPLQALSKREERLFKRMLARREEIAKELVEIELKLLPKKRWRWKIRRRSKSPKRDKRDKPVKNVRV